MNFNFLFFPILNDLHINCYARSSRPERSFYDGHDRKVHNSTPTQASSLNKMLFDSYLCW